MSCPATPKRPIFEAPRPPPVPRPFMTVDGRFIITKRTWHRKNFSALFLTGLRVHKSICGGRHRPTDRPDDEEQTGWRNAAPFSAVTSLVVSHFCSAATFVWLKCRRSRRRQKWLISSELYVAVIMWIIFWVGCCVTPVFVGAIVERLKIWNKGIYFNGLVHGSRFRLLPWKNEK